MKKQYKNLIIQSDKKISEYDFNKFSEEIIIGFNKINSFLNIESYTLIINIVSPEDFVTIVKAKSTQYKEIPIPNWLVGFSNIEECWIIEPNENNFDEMVKIALHELTHLMSYKLNTSKKRLKILDEGIAIFLSNQYEGKILTPWVNAYLNHNLPKMSFFCTYDSIEFTKQKGYQYAHLIIEYLINTYGKQKFLNWLQNPEKFIEELPKIDTNFENYIIKKITEKISK